MKQGIENKALIQTQPFVYHILTSFGTALVKREI